MSSVALNQALELVPANQIAQHVGCNRQSICVYRAKGVVPDTDIGRKVADAIEELTAGEVTAAEIMRRDPTDAPLPPKAKPAGNRAVANLKSSQTSAMKRGDIPVVTSEDIQQMAAESRAADARKKIADANLTEERHREKRTANEIAEGNLLPAADVHAAVARAGAVFRRDAEALRRAVEEVASPDCKDAVAEAAASSVAKMQQAVMTALQGTS